MLNLAFCIIRKDNNSGHVVPNLSALKEEFFGHADLILHEPEMRRKTCVFARSRDQPIHTRWMTELLAWIDQTETSVVSACIDKVALSRRYAHPFDPYDLVIRFCLERTRQFLALNHQAHRRTQMIFESRGKRYDRTTQIEVQQTLTWANPLGHHQPDFSRFPIEPLFTPKQSNPVGHQLCDLLARSLAN